MKSAFARTFCFFLLVLILLNSGPVLDASEVEVIRTTDQFIRALEEEYQGIEDFTARLTLSGLNPPIEVLVEAISEPRTLKVQYLSPSEMKGQFFLLEKDYLYQYMPGREIVIKKELTRSNIPVRAANLTPDYLLKLIRSDDLEVNLIGGPMGFYYGSGGRNSLDSKTSCSSFDNETEGNETLYHFFLGSTYFLGPSEGNYVLEVIPQVEGYQFSRQVIKFSPDSLLPVELITHFEDSEEESVRTIVEEAKTNVGLKRESLTELPDNAEVISG